MANGPKNDTLTKPSYLLIVDPDPYLLQILSGYFRRDSRVVYTARDRLEARKVLAAFGVPAVILSDLMFAGEIDEDWITELRGMNATTAFLTASPEFAPPDFPLFSKPAQLSELNDFVIRYERLAQSAD
ncbi:MAG: hypothetical protein QM831_22150 [Kofleriaceae bacterium]